MQAALREAGISVLGGDRAAPRMGLGPAPSARIEYGSNTLTLELVASMDEAIDHIHAHGSSHTEAIITGACPAVLGSKGVAYQEPMDLQRAF